MASRFFFLVVLLTWIAWVPAVWILNGTDSVTHRILLHVGSLGSVVALNDEVRFLR
jgi:hypothetical protein